MANKRYLKKLLKYRKETMRTVKATPDLMPEANKFETIGVKKIIRNIGNK